jgi:hypothetical protein
VQRLAGLETLGLLPPHPTRVHLTYLDPEHLAAGGRRFDVAVVGDSMVPAYRPRLVIISENKDTAIYFPPTAGAIAVEGGGDAGPPAISRIPWICECPAVCYWGDIDADGFEIVNAYRATGLTVDTLLMDLGTFQRYKHFGTYRDRKGKLLGVRQRRNLSLLTEAEAEMYEALTDPASTDPPRLEQERVPLADAAAAVLASVTLQ